MTDNMDEFENDEFSPEDRPKKGGLKKNLLEEWKSNPLFKLIAIMVFVGLVIASVLGVFSGGPDPERSNLVKAPNLSEPPGSTASPFFIEQNKQSNDQRANEAIKQGSSSLPTPVGKPEEFKIPSAKDPLVEFRAETERLRKELKQEQELSNQKIQALQQQQMTQLQQTQKEWDDSLAKAMQKQMQQLMDSWVPKSMKLVSGVVPPKSSKEVGAENRDAQQIIATNDIPAPEDKTVVQAGTVNYAQLLTEANSDVPSPILAQILSGPLAGGRAIGKFKVSYDYLIIEFSLINHKGKDYSVSALALDPDTTLAGMATEVDHRYFSRVILPAAGAFVSEFGRVMSEPTQEVTTTETTTTVTQTERGIEDATYAGVGSAANTISRFLEREGQRIQPLVRVAVGTPMGIFFLQPVKESGKSSGQNVTNSKEIPPGYYPAAYGNGSMQPQMQQPTGQDTYQMNTYKPAQGMIVTPNSGQMPYSGYNYNR